MSKYIQIQAQIEQLQKEAAAVRKREIAETIAKIKKAIQAFGLTAEDLGLTGATKPAGQRGRKAAAKASATGAGTKRRGRPAKSANAKAGKKTGRKTAKKLRGTDKRSVVAPKYRDAATGATWTGRGKQPKWLAAAIESGKLLDSFKI